MQGSQAIVLQGTIWPQAGADQAPTSTRGHSTTRFSDHYSYPTQKCLLHEKFVHYPTRYYLTTRLWVHYPTLPYPKLKNHYSLGPVCEWARAVDQEWVQYRNTRFEMKGRITAATVRGGRCIVRDASFARCFAIF